MFIGQLFGQVAKRLAGQLLGAEQTSRTAWLWRTPVKLFFVMAIVLVLVGIIRLEYVVVDLQERIGALETD